MGVTELNLGHLVAANIRPSLLRVGVRTVFNLVDPVGTKIIVGVSVLPSRRRKIEACDRCNMVGDLFTGPVLDKSIEALTSSSEIRDCTGGNLYVALWLSSDNSVEMQLFDDFVTPPYVVEKRRARHH